MTTATSKQKTNSGLLLGGLALLAVAGFAGYNYYQFADRLRILPTKISFGGNILFPVINVSFLIQNNVDYTVTFNYINGEILYKNMIVGYVSTTSTKQDLLPNQSITVDVQVNTSLKDDLTVLVDVIKSGLTSDFVFDGIIAVDGVRVPVKENFA